MSTYLNIAEKVLRETRQPMSAKQILHAAYQMQIVPSGLYGKTQHKTLQARISVDILKYRSRSKFARISPGRFVLKDQIKVSSASKLSERHRNYVAQPRIEQLKNYDALCVYKNSLESETYKSIFTIRELEVTDTFYERLSIALRRSDIAPVRIIVIIRNHEQTFIHTSAGEYGDQHDGSLSIGLMGYVRREDFTLFATDKFGVRESTDRIIIERLYLPHNMLESLPIVTKLRESLCILNMDDGINGSVSIIVMIQIAANSELDLFLRSQKGVIAHHNPERINNLDRFDRLSKVILCKQLLDKFPKYLT